MSVPNLNSTHEPWGLTDAMRVMSSVEVIVPPFIPEPCEPKIYPHKDLVRCAKSCEAWHAVIQNDTDFLTGEAAPFLGVPEGIYRDYGDLIKQPAFRKARQLLWDALHFDPSPTLGEAREYWAKKCRELHATHDWNCGVNRERKEAALCQDAEYARLSLLHNELAKLAPDLFVRSADPCGPALPFPQPPLMDLRGFRLFVLTHIGNGVHPTLVHSLQEAQIEVDRPVSLLFPLPKKIYFTKDVDDAIKKYKEEVRKWGEVFEQELRDLGFYGPRHANRTFLITASPS
ncbi:hypothetical protein AAF712_010621 [Marasmius tenuissimus]|uniref:F-box domain-containing protein n=1 Tax=Marasmius tenuissimus TaxID=585030 RepID=A0ABR2ZMA6_9AGAR|nr:hypothetical protein PM082_000051 [Marasmius tenuissimus]